jgi:fimbrial chaperone protein
MNFFIFLLTLLFTQTAEAFKIKIIDSTLLLDKGMNSTTATVVNDSENMIAIEANALVRRYNPDGTENLETIADDLIIVPGQMIIPPNSEQVLNIRWVGPKTIEAEKAYRLLIEYVSISEDKLKGIEPTDKKAGVTINYRIGKSFYVTPKNAHPNVALTKVQQYNKEGIDALQMSFENLGTQHQIVHVMNIQFTTSSGENIPVSFTKSELGNSINFLAKAKRNVDVALPEALKGKQIVTAAIVDFDSPADIDNTVEE